MKYNKVINDYNKCCGCAACVRVCTKQAISLVPDKMGFVYPNINNSICISCDVCTKICPVNNFNVEFNVPQQVWALKNKNEAFRRTSQSGGATPLFAEYVLNNGGVVYGSTLNQGAIEHMRISTIENLPLIFGSKYAQSSTEKVWEQMWTDLTEDKMVLFFGTPCQCAAAKALFGKYSKLILVDIICHGVPSNKFWQDYVEMVAKKEGARVSRVEFRDVSDPWGTSNERFELDDGRVLKKKEYLGLFYSNSIARISCSTCPYAKKERIGDVTIGDFWGIQDVQPEFADDIGISAVLLNTVKGKKLYSAVCENANAIEMCLADVQKKNEPLNRPSGLSRSRKLYEFIYSVLGVKGVLIYNKLIKNIKSIIRRIVK